MDEFWKLLKESVIVQASVTLVMTLLIAYMYAEQIPIPQELMTAYAVVLGYYFGSKTQNLLNRS